MRKWWLILGAIALIILAAAMDILFHRFAGLNHRYSDGLHPVIPWGMEIVVYFIIGFLLLWLAWLALDHAPRSYLTASFLIILGAVFLFAFTYPGYRIFTSIIQFPYAQPNQVWSARPLYLDLISSRFSFARMTAGVVTAIGVLRMLPNTKLWSEKKEI